MPHMKIYRNCTLPKYFPNFSTQKKSRNFAGRIWRFLRKGEIGQILGKHFIQPKKAKACSKKILGFKGEVSLLI